MLYYGMGGVTMEKVIKLLAVSIIIGCLLLSVAIIGKSYIETRYDRYYFSRVADGSPMVFDNATGKYYFYSSSGFHEWDNINKSKK
jgi:CHASE1-domain containing sensor protein